jgi:hypothetical protein
MNVWYAPYSDKVGRLRIGRITEYEFSFSTVPSIVEINRQQAENSGIKQYFACMKFGHTAIIGVTHNPYRPMTGAVGKDT